MCGIVGYLGPKDAVSVILSGLKRLEYRGYDSAGIALLESPEIRVIKTPGKIAELEEAVSSRLGPDPAPHHLGIGHTRWATHGAPSEKNAHPHVSADGRIALVHNGIIENYNELRRGLEARGVPFLSETDTEVLAHLIGEAYTGDLTAAVTEALRHVEGTYGIAVLAADQPDLLVAARKGSPIVVGLRDGETIVASDISAIIQHTNKVIFLDDGDILTVRADALDITSMRNVPVARAATEIDWDPGSIEKGGFAHFMLKEIHEQPEALENTLRGRLVSEDGTSKLSGLQMSPADMARINRVVLTGCGTSLYAAMVGGYLFEDFADMPCQVEQAAEFRYRNPILHPDSCVLAISQSGETADTLAAVREARRKGASVLGICNVVGSTIARETGRGVYLHAGPEIGVASTKAFTCQVSVLALLALALGRTRRMSVDQGMKLVRELQRLPAIVAGVLAQEDHIRSVAERIAPCENAFYIGRGYLYPAALEGALKLKEISYIHAEGYHAAELKHGPIALLEDKVPVVACVAETPGRGKTIGNMQECRARKSPVIAIATEGDTDIDAHSDAVIRIPRCEGFLAPIPVVVAEQLLAYHVAALRGCPIDQPRNLAKSVTVE